jgi:hypothetical protein
MTSSARYVPNLRSRVSPLFAALYLPDDPDEEERDERRSAGKRKAARARVARIRDR